MRIDGPLLSADGNRASDRTPGPEPGSLVADYVVSAVVLTSASATLILIDPRLRHWFLVPVTIAGALIAVDVVRWLRRALDTFHPQGILALLGVHFFYLAPILHVMLDRWPTLEPGTSDWRSALGAMALVNVVGLFLYRFVLSFRDRSPDPRRPVRQLDTRNFYPLGLLAVALSMAAFAVLCARFGGISAYLTLVAEDVERDQLAGLGWLLLLAEAFPMLAFALAAVRWRAALAKRPGALVMLVVLLAIVQFTVGGLRGSRSNTVYPILMSLVLVHLLIVRISRRSLLVISLATGAFLYAYGIYKDAGTEVLDVARGSRSVQELSADTGRDLPTLLLGDFGRADIQALILDRQLHGQGEPALGITYLGDVSILVPNALLPHPPRDKVAVGTDVMYGPGRFESGNPSSRVYGLAGEAVLNFGPLGGVASFAVLGLVIRLLRRLYRRAAAEPALPAKLLVPLLSVPAFLANDLDNNTWFLVKYAAPLAIVTWLSLQKRRSEPAWAREPRPRYPVAARGSVVSAAVPGYSST
ncbi:hypothetical protein Q2K19_00725 [Micromonospora soli]|uniref:hypothetical protein n=1 Tax=Micromonospora sp. NBRC 110009 TaxID=3061627 RepID=UPI002672869C|nr:hypothetical protein [Micromonospora sp. NBRC 110009]WKT99075.1 hypothetical protein Q2K19_00725 [Micromonospora sp. NBRC 110009]